MSVVLGINAYHAGASAAIVVDGKLVVAIPEERLNRVKYFGKFPRLALTECLRIAGISINDIDCIAVGGNRRANIAAKLRYAVRNGSGVFDFIRILAKKRPLVDLRKIVADQCGVSEASLHFEVQRIEHHLAHTASSYYTSGWDHAAGITIDGSGDFVTVMMSECAGNQIKIKSRIYVPHSLGTFYSMVCEFIGFRGYGDEGKVMGLAPYGSDSYRVIFERVILSTDTGFILDPIFFQKFSHDAGFQIENSGEIKLAHSYSDEFVRLLGPARRPGAPLAQRDLDLAFGVQAAFERTYMHLLRVLARTVPETRVAMAGGCVLNSVANGKVFAETPFKETAIHPAAGDDGLAVGAALYASHVTFGEKRHGSVPQAYLGQEFDDATILIELERRGISSIKCERDDLIERTAIEIEAGSVVGWFQGRMEWGPRALGNRSILAHPGRTDMKKVLNSRIKHRENFRPFAPVVLAERQSDIFECGFPSPYMLHVYKIRPEWRDRLCTVNHVDNTGRLQSVSREENSLYYDLIKAFERRTGIPVIVNTSFNENEPIVCTPAEGIDCYMRTKMDVLVIGSFICRKT